MPSYYLGVGGNLLPEENLPRALELLREKVMVRKTSQVYRTAPIGRQEQPGYLNCVWVVETVLPEDELKELLARIERGLGRMRTADRFASRPIDLDIIARGKNDFEIIDEDVFAREFLAVCLGEVVPDEIRRREGLAAAAGEGMEKADAVTARLREILDRG
jgi:2-amino-4-hydroxy-6-hydroxymethyldihydropteridine diphosphokinase